MATYPARSAPAIQSDKLIPELDRIVRARIAADRLVMPAFPATATKCGLLLKDTNFNLKRVIGLLEADPVFAALVLKAASTAHYGGTASRSLEQAVNRLGVNTLRPLLVQSAASQVFESTDRAIAQRLALIWRHSVAVGVLARDVGSLMRSDDVETCYMAGLLHDIGKPVVATLLLEAERQLGKQGWLSVDQWYDVIDAIHRPLGVMLAEKWNLAPEVTSAIQDCNEYDPGDRRSPANVVRFCNALVKGHGFATTPSFDAEDAAALVMIGRSMLGLDEDVVVRLAKGLRERIDDSMGPPGK